MQPRYQSLLYTIHQGLFAHRMTVRFLQVVFFSFREGHQGVFYVEDQGVWFRCILENYLPLNLLR